MEKTFTVAIIGVGARGADVYGPLIHRQKNRYNIVALCDCNVNRLESASKKFEVSKENCFADENEFFKQKRADLLLVATQDRDHYGHCLKGFELCYDIMTEKPLTDSKEECLNLLKAQKQSGRKALVCHVLRYAPAFLKAAELIDEGHIGKLVAINALERVAYWHQAHSYIRGNWRNTDIAAPMILAKCCHDLDLFQYYAKSKCESISSTGNLVFFKKENMPKEASDYCVNCTLKSSCPYSAEKIYMEKWHEQGCPDDSWPYNVITASPVTKEKIVSAIENGPYGRCVFNCDNNVVDHQLTTMTFENGVKATLTMTGFTSQMGRRYHFHGTLGELILDEAEHRITINKFGRDVEYIDFKVLEDGGYGHGGGDFFLIEQLYDVMQGKSVGNTSFEASVESHLMGICAEESRLRGGSLINIH